MNQMSPRPGNAARLSEDIGDVLSAIRRLIAEDEALDYARDTLEKQQVALADDPETASYPLARPHDGHAAMARRMVAQGTAALSARMAKAVAPQPASDMVPASFRSRLVADDSAPASRSVSGRLIASRDLPARRDHASLGAPPLRLREADRVITGIAEETEALSPWADHPQQIVDVRSMAASRVEVVPQASAAIEDDDDFAEAFDAKARMRPVLEAPFIADLSTVPAAADAFWQAYENAPDQLAPDQFAAEDALIEDAEDDTWIGAALDDSDLAIEAGTFETLVDLEPAADDSVGQAAEMIEDAVSEVPDAADDAPAFVALSIPSYPADEIVEEPEAQLIAEPQPEPTVSEVEVEASAKPEAPAVASAIAPVAADASVAMVDEAADVATDDEEATIRELIREMVQEELHGELGQRFSRNLRAVIRREVASAIDDHLERL